MTIDVKVAGASGDRDLAFQPAAKRATSIPSRSGVTLS